MVCFALGFWKRVEVNDFCLIKIFVLKSYGYTIVFIYKHKKFQLNMAWSLEVAIFKIPKFFLKNINFDISYLLGSTSGFDV